MISGQSMPIGPAKPTRACVTRSTSAKSASLHLIGAQQLEHLCLIQLTISPQQEGIRLAIHTVDQRLDKVFRLQVEKCRHFFNGLGVRRLPQFIRSFFRHIILLAFHHFGDLQVAGEIAVLAADHNVLADAGHCLELYGQQTAHRAGIRLYDLIADAHAVKGIAIAAYIF